ncbi:hypothetical protein BDW66DRAFT_127813 [Aspergillus desertorum]
MKITSELGFDVTPFCCVDRIHDVLAIIHKHSTTPSTKGTTVSVALPILEHSSQDHGSCDGQTECSVSIVLNSPHKMTRPRWTEIAIEVSLRMVFIFLEKIKRYSDGIYKVRLVPEDRSGSLRRRALTQGGGGPLRTRGFFLLRGKRYRFRDAPGNVSAHNGCWSKTLSAASAQSTPSGMHLGKNPRVLLATLTERTFQCY